MPELPEVETVVRRIRPSFEGHVLEGVDILDERWCAPAPAPQVEGALSGSRVRGVGRRGKYILLELETGATLVMHLRMTGTILIDPLADPGHVRVEFALSGGSRIVFNDPRRFGTGELVDSSKLDEWFAGRLGLEPFDEDFTDDHLFRLTRNRRSPLKSFLLNQKLIAGIGNIYADEALFRAGLHPLRLPAGLSHADAAALRRGVIDSLTAGIEAGGATIDDFRDPEGAWGAYQSEFLVHRREGRACPDCGDLILRTKVGGRATYFCPSCQRRGRSLRRT